MNPIRWGVGAIAALALTTMCLAGPRNTLSYSNVDSVGPVGSASNQTRTYGLSGGYPIRRIDFSGTLKTLINGSKPVESFVRITPPAGQGGAATFAIAGGINPAAPGSTHDGLGSVDAPPGWTASGTFTIEFYQTVDHGAGADARWTIATITFNDAPEPPVNNGQDNLGEISDGTVSRTVNVGLAQTHWFRFSVPQAIGAIGYNYAFDIDTVGSNLTPINDTMMALYNAGGELVASNDDAEFGVATSLLTHGVGWRAAPTLVTEANHGRNGSLDAGTYYLAVFGYNAGNFFLPNFSVTNGSIYTGTITVNFRTSIPNPSGAACPADFNASGSVNVQDIFAFLTAWFAGCP